MTIAQFNASAQTCHEGGDRGTAVMFEQMVHDEEAHTVWLESQLSAIARVDGQQYLAQHMLWSRAPSRSSSGSRPSAG